MRWVQLDQELNDEGGLGQDLVDVAGLVSKDWHKTTLRRVSEHRAEGIERFGAYRIELQEPLWSRFVEIHEDLFVGETELPEDDVYAVGPPTEVLSGCIFRV